MQTFNLTFTDPNDTEYGLNLVVESTLSDLYEVFNALQDAIQEYTDLSGCDWESLSEMQNEWDTAEWERFKHAIEEVSVVSLEDTYIINT